MRESIPLEAHEHWPCHAGSGECSKPAIVNHDDGSGGDFFLCETHNTEFNAMEAWLGEEPDKNASMLRAAMEAVE